MDATAEIGALIDTLKLNDGVLNVAMTDLTDELANRRLREGGPSIAWNIGHMLHYRNQIAGAVSCAGPTVKLERYTTTATDGHDYPPAQQFQAAWVEFSTRFVSALSRLSPEDLNGPSPIRLPHGEQTLLDALRFVIWHEGLHLGQISMLRSHHGLTPVVTLVLQRVAVAQ
jgi:uncharacterized damage-inducible protein DinB